MNKEDKQRVIGKVIAINSDRFTIELLAGIDNFNINGFDDIHYFAQLNSYIILPYQNYYIVAEVAGVREKDVSAPSFNTSDIALNKARVGKYLEVLPIGTLRSKSASPTSLYFDFGVSVFPALYTDALYIKETELDALFNIEKASENICTKPEEHLTICDCESKRYLSLAIGKSTVFPDYDVKIDIDKFFSSHSAILGNSGSGKSCTIASMLQGLYRFNSYSATGSTFIIFDTNGEYQQAFADIQNTNEDLSVKGYSVSSANAQDGSEQFYLPHWFLNIDEWALLLQATEKTQLPILRNALGLASTFKDTGSVEKVKNHILATCITEVLRDETGSGSKKDRIISILQKFNTPSINLGISIPAYKEGNQTYPANSLRDSLTVFYGEIKKLPVILEFLESKETDGKPRFLLDEFRMPAYDKGSKFDYEDIYSAIDLAILYEEAHGNRHIRDYCSSLMTRVNSIVDRDEFNFFKSPDITFDTYTNNLLGIQTNETQQSIKNQQILILDLSAVEDDVIELISCVLTRIIYEKVRLVEPRNSFPVNLILEEAHRYICEIPKGAFLKANKIFETVAKEGRKFGLLLMISSQRPSELSKTVLSQCANFIVHRIQNPDDLSHIRQITPHISETILRRMPSIPTQNALIFGHAVNLPTTFKVNEASPRPKSDNNKISINWFRPSKFLISNA